jgi:ketosteroid isomerase-like protein
LGDRAANHRPQHRAALSETHPADRVTRTSREREVTSRFVADFERGDVNAIVDLLADDAWLTMPPLPFEYQGHEAISRFLSNVSFQGGARQARLVATRANGQPAYGCYVVDPHAPIAHAHGMMVLTVRGNLITTITRFLDNSALPRFGLPGRSRRPDLETAGNSSDLRTEVVHALRCGIRSALGAPREAACTGSASWRAWSWTNSGCWEARPRCARCWNECSATA